MLKGTLKRSKGITLIALVVTIIVLFNISRNKYKYVNGTEWNTE